MSKESHRKQVDIIMGYLFRNFCIELWEVKNHSTVSSTLNRLSQQIIEDMYILPLSRSIHSGMNNNILSLFATLPDVFYALSECSNNQSNETILMLSQKLMVNILSSIPYDEHTKAQYCMDLLSNSLSPQE